MVILKLLVEQFFVSPNLLRSLLAVAYLSSGIPRSILQRNTLLSCNKAVGRLTPRIFSR
jgi:hypothetical protein